MSTFIKAGFWEKRNLAPKHWLNLDLLISSIVPSAFPYKSFIGHLYQPGGPTSGVPPQLGVIYNTLGTVTAELDADSGSPSGYYKLVSDGLFNPTKTSVVFGIKGGDTNIVFTSSVTENYIFITATDISGNPIVIDTTVEIKVFTGTVITEPYLISNTTTPSGFDVENALCFNDVSKVLTFIPGYPTYTGSKQWEWSDDEGITYSPIIGQTGTNLTINPVTTAVEGINYYRVALDNNKYAGPITVWYQTCL